MEENKNKKFVIIIVVLSLLLIGTTGYIVYDKVFRNSKDQDTIQKNENNTLEHLEEEDSEVENENEEFSDESETVKNEKIKISEVEVKKIYYDIFNYGNQQEIIEFRKASDSGFDFMYNAYDSKKVIIKQDFVYDELMEFVFRKIPNNKIKSESQSSNDGSVTETNEFLISDLEEAYKFYFGENKEWKNFEAGYPLGNCKVKGDYYKCNAYLDAGFGDTVSDEAFLTVYDKYETDENNIYVYDKAIYFNGNNNRFYKKYVSGNFISEVKSLRGKDITELLKNKSELLTYKHTFKQNSDGTFYLYSSEPVV